MTTTHSQVTIKKAITGGLSLYRARTLKKRSNVVVDRASVKLYLSILMVAVQSTVVVANWISSHRTRFWHYVLLTNEEYQNKDATQRGNSVKVKAQLCPIQDQYSWINYREMTYMTAGVSMGQRFSSL